MKKYYHLYEVRYSKLLHDWLFNPIRIYSSLGAAKSSTVVKKYPESYFIIICTFSIYGRETANRYFYSKNVWSSRVPEDVSSSWDKLRLTREI